jgi:hypothetical protein
MSLINDALKQAKQAQQEAAPPPAPNLQLRPIEPMQYTRRSVAFLWPASLVVVSLLLLFFVWQEARRIAPPPPIELQARASTPAARAAAPQPTPAPAAPAPAVQPAPEPAPAALPAPMAGSTDVVQIAAVPLTINPPVAINPDDGIPNPTVTPQLPPPKPVPPKLQAIVLSPVRPSVMISGRTLFIGDKLEEMRVAAIDRESVTLVGAGKTNILSLSE